MFVIPSLLLIGSVELSDSNLSTPEPYGEFHSNLGAQNLVEDIRADVWVGPTPQELAANVMPLGSLSRLSIRQNPKISRKELVKVPLLVDMRNIYKPAEMVETGVRYVSLGRPEV